jgi:hypothetical protein
MRMWIAGAFHAGLQQIPTENEPEALKIVTETRFVVRTAAGSQQAPINQALGRPSCCSRRPSNRILPAKQPPISGICKPGFARAGNYRSPLPRP